MSNLCGWHDTKTGESGKFDKDGVQVSCNIWDKIKFWWCERQENKWKSEQWEFSDIVKMENWVLLYNRKYNTGVIEDYSVYC